MGTFDKGGRKGGGGFGRKKSFGGRDSGGFRTTRPQMHNATCSKCGNDCEVPFRPTGSKPVFCSNCFDKNNGGSKTYRGSNNRHAKKELYKTECSECGNTCEIPFAPRPGRSVLCDSCYGKQKKAGADNTAELAQKLDALHAKVDRLIEMIDVRTDDIVTEQPETTKKRAKTKVEEEISFDDAPVKKAPKKTTTKKAPAKKTVKKVTKKVTKKAVKKTTKKATKK